MELSDPAQTFESFEKAIAQNKDDPDIFYHRGQGAFEYVICILVYLEAPILSSPVHHGRIPARGRRLPEVDGARRHFRVQPYSAGCCSVQAGRYWQEYGDVQEDAEGVPAEE